MNRKGQVTIGLIVMVFVMVVVGVAFLTGGIASNVENLRQTTSVVNETITAPATGSVIEITGSGIVGSAVVTNATSGAVVPATNYTIAGRQPPITSGVVTNTYTSNGGGYSGESVNVSYTAEPDGYDTSAGGRAIILLVTIFVALAIGVIALVPAARSGVMEMFGR